MKQKSVTNRVEVGGGGIGEVSDEMISKRARNLATADGRDEASPGDISEARAELSGSDLNSAEDETDLIAEEDRPGNGFPARSTGSQAPRLELEDEGNLADQEVQEGIDEADLDTRVKSRHPG